MACFIQSENHSTKGILILLEFSHAIFNQAFSRHNLIQIEKKNHQKIKSLLIGNGFACFGLSPPAISV